MVKIQEVYDYLDSIAPFEGQADFDNSGFLVGDINRYVKHIGLVLDITKQTLKEAVSLDVDLIITHHPVIFNPQKSFLAGDLGFELAASGIATIATHTSLDAADGGVNDVLAELLEVKKTEPLPSEDFPQGLLRVGFVDPMSATQLAEHIGEKLYTHVKYFDAGREIETLAICGGSGGSMMQDVLQAGVDAFLVGEISHQHFLDAANKSLSVFAAGHFETESPAMEVLARKLQSRFPETSISVLQQDSPTEIFVPEALR